MKKKIFALLIAVMFIGACSAPANVCGTKKQHKARKAKMGKMAPSMSR